MMIGRSSSLLCEKEELGGVLGGQLQGELQVETMLKCSAIIWS